MKALFTNPFLNSVCAASVVLLLGISACDSGSTDEDPDPMLEFDRAEMLSNIGNNIIVPAYQAFLSDVNALQQSGASFSR